MIEVALVFDRAGRGFHWHAPPGASRILIPDSRSLWEVLWESRDRLGGVAHTHPDPGGVSPSRTDLTTWSACERALGRRLLWPIATSTEVATWAFAGPGDLDYARAAELPLRADDLDELRRRSKGDTT